MKAILHHPALNLLLGALLGGLIVTTTTAQSPESKPVDETELLMEQSLATMAKVRAATQKADKVVVEKVSELKEEVKTLTTQNNTLKNEVQKLEMVIAAPTLDAVPFDILAIIPDSTN